MCTIVCPFVLFIFSHGVVSLLSIYEFDCPSGIFRPSFINLYAIIKLHKILSVVVLDYNKQRAKNIDPIFKKKTLKNMVIWILGKSFKINIDIYSFICYTI